MLGDSSSLGIPNNNLDNAALNRIVDLVFMIAGSVAVIIVIVAGINYALLMVATYLLVTSSRSIPASS